MIAMVGSKLVAKIRKFVFSKELRIFAAKEFASYVQKSLEVLFALQRIRSLILWMFYQKITGTILHCMLSTIIYFIYLQNTVTSQNTLPINQDYRITHPD